MAASPSTPRLFIGESSFERIRQKGSLFVDKSPFIQEVLETSAAVILLPRPRRFGKTTNMTMLRSFLDLQGVDRSHYFSDLRIWQQTDLVHQHFQQYPVIFISLNSLKARTWAEMKAKLHSVIQYAYHGFRYLHRSKKLSSEQKELFHSILMGTAKEDEYESAFRSLCEALQLHHGVAPWVLMDEYDTPIHTAWMEGFYADAIMFFRSFMGSTFKDNPFLNRGVITGIMRISQESMFSDINNIAVYSLTSNAFRSAFGFTTEDVRFLLNTLELQSLEPQLTAMYNGYKMGGTETTQIYNPFSIVRCLSEPSHAPMTYWLNTSSNDLIYSLLRDARPELSEQLLQLISGQTLTLNLDENIVLTRLHESPLHVWSFLYYSGYLTQSRYQLEMGELPEVDVIIPNREIRLIFKQAFLSWLALQPSERGNRQLLTALVDGNPLKLEKQLNSLLLSATSFMDTAAKQPEKFYHGLLLGLACLLSDKYRVRSNREAGLGRADLLIQSPELGMVLELKVLREGQSVRQAMTEALEQLRTRAYAQELGQSQRVLEYAVVFHEKQAWVRQPGQPLETLPELRRVAPRGAPARTVQPPRPDGGEPPALTAMERLQLSRAVVPRLSLDHLQTMRAQLGLPTSLLNPDDFRQSWSLMMDALLEAGQASTLLFYCLDTWPELAEVQALQPLLERVAL